MEELQPKTKNLKKEGAASPDNIPPSFLKSFGPLTLQELLSILNLFFCHAHCIQTWRVAIIIPSLWAEKSLDKIALLCLIVRLLERIYVNFLYSITELKNLFRWFQNSFWTRRSMRIRSPWSHNLILHAHSIGSQESIQCNLARKASPSHAWC